MSAGNTQAVAERAPQTELVAPAASESAAILSLIERMATNPEISPERVERFIELRRQMARDEARKIFDEAIADAKAEIPPVERNRTGNNQKRYADFSAYARVVDPILAKHGLSYRFRTQQTDKISVTCVLSHKAGYSEETTLSGPADATGSKNAIQAIGSTLTYLQRYTLVQALGLAAADDDDGKAASAGVTISDEQLAKLRALIDEVGGDTAKLCAHFKIEALPDLPVAKLPEAVGIVELKRQRVAK
jgi:hypothetical protein